MWRRPSSTIRTTPCASPVCRRRHGQLHAVAATAAPAGVVLGGGDPIVGLQRAVADHHSIASPFSPQTTFAPQRTFAPETNTEFASRNDTDLLSNNDTRLASPQAGESVQQVGSTWTSVI